MENLVWAKMTGRPEWPGRITNPPLELGDKPNNTTGPVHCIFFFGSNNYAWIEESQIKNYAEYRDEFIESSETAAFKEAVKKIDEYISDPVKYRHNAEPHINREPSDNAPDKLFKNATNDGDADVDCNETVAAAVEPPKSVKKKTNPPEIGIQSDSQTWNSKNINPSLRFGFLGLGIMGSRIAGNLLDSGHKVVVWNRILNKCHELEEAGAEVVDTPCAVIDSTDITFSCASDPSDVEQMVFGKRGVLSSTMIDGKGYVEMTRIDSEMAQEIYEGITSRGGRFLKAHIHGSKNQEEEGTSVILTAGEKTLFDECQTCFAALGKTSRYLGDSGKASKLCDVLSIVIEADLLEEVRGQLMNISSEKGNDCSHHPVVINTATSDPSTQATNGQWKDFFFWVGLLVFFGIVLVLLQSLIEPYINPSTLYVVFFGLLLFSSKYSTIIGWLKECCGGIK